MALHHALQHRARITEGVDKHARQLCQRGKERAGLALVLLGMVSAIKGLISLRIVWLLAAVLRITLLKAGRIGRLTRITL